MTACHVIYDTQVPITLLLPRLSTFYYLIHLKEISDFFVAGFLAKGVRYIATSMQETATQRTLDKGMRRFWHNQNGRSSECTRDRPTETVLF